MIWEECKRLTENFTRESVADKVVYTSVGKIMVRCY